MALARRLSNRNSGTYAIIFYTVLVSLIYRVVESSVMNMDIRQVTNTSMQDNVSMQFVDVNRAPYLIVLIKLRIVVDLYEKIPMTLEVQICSVFETNWFQCGSGFSFYLIADPDPWSQPNADPDLDPSQTFKSQKVELLHKNMLKVGKRNTVPTKIQKPF